MKKVWNVYEEAPRAKGALSLSGPLLYLASAPPPKYFQLITRTLAIGKSGTERARNSCAKYRWEAMGEEIAIDGADPVMHRLKRFGVDPRSYWDGGHALRDQALLDCHERWQEHLEGKKIALVHQKASCPTGKSGLALESSWHKEHGFELSACCPICRRRPGQKSSGLQIRRESRTT